MFLNSKKLLIALLCFFSFPNIHGSEGFDLVEMTHSYSAIKPQALKIIKSLDKNNRVFLVQSNEGKKFVAKAHIKTKFFENEHHFLSMFNDQPFIVNLMGVGTYKGKQALILEHHSRDLHAYISAKKHLSEEESRGYFKQILNFLAFLKERNIAHLDIKLENMLLDDQLNLVFADFEFTHKDADQTDFPFCGTHEYMSPEMYFQESAIDLFANDLYAAGVCLYSMLAGFKPYQYIFEEEKYDANFDTVINKDVILRSLKFREIFKNAGMDLSPSALDLLSSLIARKELFGKYRLSLQQALDHPWTHGINDIRPRPEICVTDDDDDDFDSMLSACGWLSTMCAAHFFCR